MKIIDKLDRYLNDRNYQIIIKSDEINVINYDEIVDFSLTKITIKHNNQLIIIEGNNLVITKLLEQEVLINGNISNIRITK